METNENVILEEKRAKIAVERLELEKIQLENEIKALESSRNTLKEQTQSINEELGKVTDDLHKAKGELKIVLESAKVARIDMESFAKAVESFREKMADLADSYEVMEKDEEDEDWIERLNLIISKI
jgi:predicted  nucleic acid-binding Zn-ribbon protein